jgi:hypothetical protein
MESSEESIPFSFCQSGEGRWTVSAEERTDHGELGSLIELTSPPFLFISPPALIRLDREATQLIAWRS